ncbi:isoprenyl transferase [bacterium]|nr:isoprenyl transferase [bacterium]
MLLSDLKNHKNLPTHIAIIMDGNGRWARRQGLLRVKGHEEGVRSVRGAIEDCSKIGIKHLTLYTFSVENWKRPSLEISALMKLLVKTIRREIADLQKNNVRLKVIGRLDDLPKSPQKLMKEAIEQTKENTGLQLNLALSYGARQEILDAVKGVASSKTNEIDEKTFSEYMYTADIPDPDLLIRTGGEKRISNFLLWQIAYSEIVFTDTFWPEFRTEQLVEAIGEYLQRDRRFGTIHE